MWNSFVTNPTCCQNLVFMCTCFVINHATSAFFFVNFNSLITLPLICVQLFVSPFPFPLETLIASVGNFSHIHDRICTSYIVVKFFKFRAHPSLCRSANRRTIFLHFFHVIQEIDIISSLSLARCGIHFASWVLG